ncbi:MAG TPA: ATP-binding protein [Rhizomicrobium sp.]|jgi:signal transduction histidine kinase
MLLPGPPHGSFRPRHVLRSGHARTLALALIFIAAQLAIIGFAAVALESVNALRAYATGEAQWSKAQKRAVISLMHYSGSRDARDLAEYREAMKVIDGDNAARMALEKVPPDTETVRRGFLAGLNAPPDVWDLQWGFLLLHRWAPFARAVEDWRRADAQTAQLWFLSGQLRGAVETNAPLDRLRTILARISALDRGFSENEYRFSVHMGDASRTAKAATMLAMVFASLFVCLIVGVLVRHIAKEGVVAEAAAKEDVARLRDYAELASEWCCELDRDLCIRFISVRFEQIAADGALAGRHWLSLSEAPGLKPMNEAHGDTLARHLPFRNHLFRQDTGGPLFYWAVSGKPLFEKDGAFSGYRTIATDVTRFIANQEELAGARDEAVRADKAKTNFLANMSHELRTPLNAILGFSQFIERELVGSVGNPKYREYATDIRHSGEHLLATINDILELSRIEAGRVELREQAFNIREIVDNSFAACRERAAEMRLRLQVDVNRDVPPVVGDPLRFRMVLINLVSNAVKFTPPGGTVLVSVALTRDGALAIAVRDTGIGMDQEGIREALRPFGQVDSGLSRKFEGTGLGLPLVKTLVELHSGTFDIQSQPGAGTTVTITLPKWRVGQIARAVA